MHSREFYKNQKDAAVFIVNRIILGVLIVFWSNGLVAQQNMPAIPSYVAGQVIVTFQPGASANAMAAAHQQAGARELRRLGSSDSVLVEVGRGAVMSSIAAYGKSSSVRFAEPNYIRLLFIPNEGNDPQPPMGLGIDYFAEQYGLNNTGQSFYYDEWTGEPGAISGIDDADIDAVEAWDIARGDSAIKVAVLDSGIDCLHVDLVGQCIEDLNFGPSDTSNDVIGHGTHVAGIIGATGNNGKGVAGVSHDTSIGNLKVCYEYYDLFFGLVGLCDSAAIVDGLYYAANNGYHVVNMSFASPDAGQTESAAITYAWSQGLVLVAAAGNSYSQVPVYPANYPEVIAVAATDWFDNLAGFSNFGDWVSLAAPGAQTFSTMPDAACGLPDGDPDGCYGWLSGTSMASPTVAGAAALALAHFGAGTTNAAIRDMLEGNADAVGAADQNMLAWTQHGRLNLHSTLLNGSGSGPEPLSPGVHIGDIDGSVSTQGRNWTATATVSVHDTAHGSVNGYTVHGFWSEGATGDGSCTVQDGACSITSPSMVKRSVTSVRFTVSQVVGAETHLSADDHDPDGDSDGSTLLISR
jgi:thermitase